MYFKDGNVLFRSTYLHGKENGMEEWYYDKAPAQLWFKHNDVAGRWDGELVSYYPNGKVKRTEEHSSLTKLTQVNVNGIIKDTVVYKDTITSGKCYDTSGNERAFTPFELMPRPPYDMNAYLSNNLHYPNKARRKGNRGRVAVQFVVNEDGSISHLKVTRHVSPEIDDEAIRVLSRMPTWEPGMKDDKPVKVQFTQPITFKLE